MPISTTKDDYWCTGTAKEVFVSCLVYPSGEKYRLARRTFKVAFVQRHLTVPATRDDIAEARDIQPKVEFVGCLCK